MTKLLERPNLQNYDKTYRTFEWRDAESAIDFFDKKRTKLNIAYNAVTRHMSNPVLKRKVALHWENDKGEQQNYTFEDLELESNKFANFLKRLKIKKGDRCFIYLPRIPELYISFLGILKVGAIAGTLFPAFGPEGIAIRLKRGQVKLLITNTELLERVHKIKNLQNSLEYIIVTDSKKIIKRKGWQEIPYKEIKKESSQFDTVKTNKDDAAIMLFTSSTAGTPVAGIVLPHKALIQQAITARWVLDLKQQDIYWCTADPGWITGIVYGIIAPLTLGITTISYEGRFDADKWYGLIEKNKVSVLYTAPTAIRMLMAAKVSKNKLKKLKHLRHICSVGETLNPTALFWCKGTLGLPIYDTYWQTETGAIVIANYRCMPIKPGSMGKPVPGIKAAIIDVDKGKELKANETGILALAPGWPSMMSRIWKHPKLYKSYFIKDKKSKEWYITKDLAYKDKNGYYFFVGRADEIIKTAGERVSPWEIENALMQHPAVMETAVVGKPDPLRGEIIVAFIKLKDPKLKLKEKLKEEIVLFIKKKLAGHAYPREIYFVNELPKTRSGKIMRLVLKSLIRKEPISMTAIANPKCIDEIKNEILTSGKLPNK